MTLQKETPAGGDRTGVGKSQVYKHNLTCQTRRKQGLSFAEVNARALPALPALLAPWLPGGVVRGKEYISRNPTRADGKPGSFKINIRTGRWSDFATGDVGGDVIGLAAYLFNLSQGEALRRVAGMLGVRHV